MPTTDRQRKQRLEMEPAPALVEASVGQAEANQTVIVDTWPSTLVDTA